MQLEAETNGVAGVTIVVPTQATSHTTYSRPPAPAPASGGLANVTKDGGTVFAYNDAKIGFTPSWWLGSPIWTEVTGTGLSGTILDFKFDPFSARLGANNSGALAAYCATTAGIYYCPNILVAAGSAVWTQKLAYTQATCLIRTPIWAQGTIYIYGLPTAPGQPTVKKLTANGATVAWTQTVGTQASVGAFVGFEIDQTGNDEVLAAGDVGTTSYVYRILNGGAPSQLANTAFTSVNSDPTGISFIQKPLKTPAGIDNNNTGSSEYFVYAAYQQDAALTTRAFFKTTDGATSAVTDITPADGGTKYPPVSLISSIAFTSNSLIMAAATIGGRLFTSTDGGSTWTNTGYTSANETSGFFPRTQSGNYGLYIGATSDVAYSSNFGVTVASKLGNWNAAVGGSGGFRGVIPVY
jgi:hypothetical protein